MAYAFSLVIPTANRPGLLKRAVRAALQSRDVSFELIVSDNSDNRFMRDKNLEAVRGEDGGNLVQILYPSRVLAPPEHFEFALPFASGDRVAYLTDKMMLRSGTLSKALHLFEDEGADIVNWDYRIFDYESWASSGFSEEFLSSGQEPRDWPVSSYEPVGALRHKAGKVVNRSLQTGRDYARGKIVFGAYSRGLIEAIIARSGFLFAGATHDYSAMVQALSLSHNCFEIGAPGIDFASLPPSQSLGSLTHFSAPAALVYYMGFSDPDSILSNLLVPGLWASQHNMVAHDYLKYLPTAGHEDLFDHAKWLAAIQLDLNMQGKIWGSNEEQVQQVALFENFLSENRIGRGGRRVTPARPNLFQSEIIARIKSGTARARLRNRKTSN